MKESFSSLILDLFKILHSKKSKNYVQTLRDKWFDSNRKDLKLWLLNKVAVTSESRAKLVEEIALGSLDIEDILIDIVPIEDFEERNGKWVHPLISKEEVSNKLRIEILSETSKLFSEDKEKILLDDEDREDDRRNNLTWKSSPSQLSFSANVPFSIFSYSNKSLV
jgi:hypothetical protein